MVKIVWQTEDCFVNKIEAVKNILNKYLIRQDDFEWYKDNKTALFNLCAYTYAHESLELINGLEYFVIDFKDIDQEFLEDLERWTKGNEYNPHGANGVLPNSGWVDR